VEGGEGLGSRPTAVRGFSLHIKAGGSPGCDTAACCDGVVVSTNAAGGGVGVCAAAARRSYNHQQRCRQKVRAANTSRTLVSRSSFCRSTALTALNCEP